MAELNLDSSTPVIKSDNNPNLIFKINLKDYSNKLHIISLTSVLIKNISHNYVALRVRTTKKFYYAVDPIYTILPPNSEKKIKIQYNSKSNEEITSLGHKFRFEGFIIDDKEKNNQNILGLFQQYIKSQKIVKGNIIKKNVILVDENEKIINNKKIKIINLNNDDKKIKIDIPLKESDKCKLDLNDINISGLELNEKLEQEIKECKELKSIHKNLIKKLEESKIDKDKITVKEIFKEGKEILVGIKNNIFFSVFFLFLFILSIIIGFYLNK